MSAIMLTTWMSIEAMVAFAYGDGAHRQALAKGSEWFLRGSWPTSVAWWAPAGEATSWREVAERIDYLHEHGSTPYAFTLRKPFDATGQATTVDTEALAGTS